MSPMPDATGTSATVYDFICLFTHDLQRKQKRWQDGKLKYHTFNKKLMVYDDRGSFVGESHWQEDGDLSDGCELVLERGGAIVQVAECVGSRSQDLTELVEKRAKEVEMRRANKAARGLHIAASTPSSIRSGSMTHAHHLQQRSLSSLVTSPGPIGRAIVPSISPFESRVAERSVYMVASGTTSTSKRKRSVSPPSKMGHARALFGTQLSLSATPVSLSHVRREVLSSKPPNVAPFGHVVDDGHEKPNTLDPNDGSSVSIASECINGRRFIGPPQKAKPESRQGHSPLSVSDSSPPGRQKVGDAAPSAASGSVARMQDHEASQDPVSSERALPSSASIPFHDAERQRSPSMGNRGTKKRKLQAREKLQNSAQDSSRTAADGARKSKAQQSRERSKDLLERVVLSGKAEFHGVAGRSDDPPQPISKTGTRSPDHLKGLAEATTSKEAAPVHVQNQPAACSSKKRGHHSVISECQGDEPRTELRIRSRQKRGLLMLAERKTQVLSKPGQDKGLEDPAIAKTTPKAADMIDRHSARGRSVNQEDVYDLSSSDVEESSGKGGLSDARSAIPKPTTTREQDARFEKWLGRDDTLTDSGSVGVDLLVENERSQPPLVGTEGMTGEPVNKQTAEKIACKSNTKSEGKGVAKAPRIARLARKGIKSREIIGYVPDEGFDFSMPFSNISLHNAELSATCRGQGGSNETAQDQDDVAVNHSGFQATPSLLQGRPETLGELPATESIPKPSDLVRMQLSSIKVHTNLEPDHSRDGDRGIGMATRMEEVASLTPPNSTPQNAKHKEMPISAISDLSVLEELREDSTNYRATLLASDPVLSVQTRNDSLSLANVNIMAVTTAVSGHSHGQLIQETQPGLALATIADGKLATESGVFGGDLSNLQTQGVTEERHTVESSLSNGPGSEHGSLSLPIALPGTQNIANTDQSMIEEGSRKISTNALTFCSYADSGSAEQSNTEKPSTSSTTTIQARLQSTGAPRQIFNPATRGKKAAAKKDAAGMAPRTLVQLDPPKTLITRRTRVPASRPASFQTQNSVVSGFTRANGGAWSQHAHDLLGMVRPGEATAN